LLLKTFNDRFHQIYSGFFLFKYSIGYFHWQISSYKKKRSLSKYLDKYFLLSDN